MKKEKIEAAAQSPEVKPVPEKTIPEKIWLSIKDTRIDMFGLPGQTISTYCSPVMIEPSKLYLSYKSGAVLPAMETALVNKYSVELYEKFIIVAPVKGAK